MIPTYLYTCSFPTGSNYICTPPVTDTDIDEMFLCSNLKEVNTVLTNQGWERCGIDKYPLDKWLAYKKGIYNALVTDNLDHFNKFQQATEEAKRLNLLKKEDRIALFDKYLNDKDKMW